MAGSAVAIAIAGCPADGDATGGTEGSGTGSGPTTMSGSMTSAGPTTDATASSSSSTTAPPATDSTGEPPGTTGSESGEPPGTSSSTTGEAGSSSSTGEPATTTGESTDTGTQMSAACADGCVVEFECGQTWKSAEACTVACDANLEKAAAFSQFCSLAWEQLSECIGTLDCTEYAEYQNPMAFPYPCANQDDALTFECDGQ